MAGTSWNNTLLGPGQSPTRPLGAKQVALTYNRGGYFRPQATSDLLGIQPTAAAAPNPGGPRQVKTRDPFAQLFGAGDIVASRNRAGRRRSTGLGTASLLGTMASADLGLM